MVYIRSAFVQFAACVSVAVVRYLTITPPLLVHAAGLVHYPLNFSKFSIEFAETERSFYENGTEDGEVG